MMRRLLYLPLLGLGSPLWLLFRGNFGGRFNNHLSLAAVLAALPFVLFHHRASIPYLAAFDIPNALARYLAPATHLWAAYLTLALTALRWPFSIGDSQRPWSAGQGSLVLPPSLIDALSVMGIAYVGYQLIDQQIPPSTAHLGIASLAAYVLVSFTARRAGGSLPIALPSTARLEPSRPGTVARRANDDLSAIFSRRDPGLKAINQSIRGG